MVAQKESEFAFDEAGKESISDRLRQLIGKRSVRAAAQDWGLSFSTLNNYLTRGTEPSLNVAIKISNVERVSVEWLATGIAQENNESFKSESTEKTRELLRSTWVAAFEFMNQADAEAILRIIISGGARGLIKLAEHEVSLEEGFMLLPPELKERAMSLIDVHIAAKKGASQGSDIGITVGPASDTKQAG